jgi:L-lactate dehydrogenase complex protein LldG
MKQSALVDLVAQFEQAARAAGATVARIPASAEAVAAAVAGVAGEQRIAIADPQDLDPGLLDGCRKLPRVVTARNKTDLALAGVGVTDSFGCIAATGSVCVAADGEIGYISLVTRTHVVLARRTDMVERPSDVFSPDRLGGKGLRRNFVFITGPSATADMGPLVRGVHGPHHLHVLLLD